jgi:type I restriction enzyme S subunit
MAATIHPLFQTPLPNRWRLATVDDIKSPEKSSCVAGPFGSNISSKYFVESGVPVIRGGNLRDDLTRFVPKGFAFVSEEQATKYKAQHVRSGDLVFTCWGTIGQVGLIPSNGPFPEYIISNKQLKLRPNLELADPVYLFFYFAGPKMVQHVLGKAIGAAVPGINLGILKELPVVLPPLPVQRRIAGILSAYDELMENSQRRIRILEAMARALYREWFVHFRFPGHEKSSSPAGRGGGEGRAKLVTSPLSDIPQGWEVKPFTEIADVLSGGTPKTDVAEYWNGEIPFFTPRDVPACFYVQDTDKHVTELGLSKCASELYPPDTVFITARGTVGKVALPSVPMAMNQSCYALRGKPGIPQRFLFLMTLQQVDYLKTNTGGATFDTIVVDTFRRMEVVKPAREIIARFARQTDAIFEQVNTLQRQIQNLRRTRDLLLPRLLNGQVPIVV